VAGLGKWLYSDAAPLLHQVELEEDYGYADADLKVMSEKYGTLASHHERTLAAEAVAHEEALAAMGSRVTSLKV
jgi:hypothetical protein